MSSNAFIESLHKVANGENLNREEMQRAVQIMMTGGATPAQIAAFLVALRIKGETVEELTGAAMMMRQKALAFDAPADAIDTCGTGGDASGTYNISTATAILVAACGVPVVKHGNRSVSSRSGSADVMREMGVNLAASPTAMQTALNETNLCFLMAPNHHRAMRHISPVRQELGLRTLFNLLGPLSNPAGVKRQLLGVYDAALLQPIAEVLRELGTEAAWVVHGDGGLDEISLTGSTQIAELKNGTITHREITPEDAGLELCEMADLKGGDAYTNALALDQLLSGKASAYRDIVCFNAAATLLLCNVTADLKEGVALASEAIDNTSARHVVNRLVEITNEELLNEQD